MKKKNLKKRLNLNYLDTTNRNFSAVKWDLPVSWCPYIEALEIDYAALYGDPSEYERTGRTAIAFYEYDEEWNGRFGLLQSIYFADSNRLEYFRDRFRRSDGKPAIFLAPDVSQISEVHRIENLHRYFESRVTSNWLVLECGGLVIPNLTASDETYFPDMIAGLEQTEVASISMKGHLQDKGKLAFSLKMVRYAAENLPKLKLLIVFTTSADRNKVKAMFEGALPNTVKVLVPATRASERNDVLSARRERL